MRTIKFRAWDKKNKKMLDWSWFQTNQCCEMFENTDVELMQYTGLRDKAGTRIYEGDIIDYGSSRLCEIVYRDGYLKIKTKNNNHLFINDGVGEVIGNIYENPELIK